MGWDLEAAAAALAAGGLVAFPTETVYGLGARADDDAAVARIFKAKGRPADHPLIVHVWGPEQARIFAAQVPPIALRLMQAFWPGPLTLIVPRRPELAAACAGGQDSIGLRCPSHPMARDLLHRLLALGVPGVAAPSANRFGRVSPTSAQHVRDEFGDAMPVLDGGSSEVGIESAIVDCSREHPVLLRPGTLGRAAIEAAMGVALGEVDAQAPRASGTLESHYAPAARVRLFSADEMDRALQAVGAGRGSDRAVALYSSRHPGQDAMSHLVAWRQRPQEPQDVARDLFAAMRDLDARLHSACGAEGGQMWIEFPPEDARWEGVRDRLRRAAAQ